MSKILVTGADGFIGSHLVEGLLAKGYDVKAFVQYNSFNSWGWLDNLPKSTLKNIEIFSGDIRDSYGVRRAMTGCKNVLHLAALIAIPFSYHSPETYVDTNIKGTLNILQAAKDMDIEVIHTSTSEVYGSADYVPIDENHPLKGQSPYSATKIAADQLALSFYRSFNTPITIARPFNTYGPRQSARAVIPTIISQINNKNESIMLGSLHPTRDFNYVEDTVSGFISILESRNTYGDVFNIGSNFEISIKETAEIIVKLMNSNQKIKLDPDRLRPSKSEVDRLFSDNSKISKVCKWKPSYGGIDGFQKGLKETIDWFGNSENLAKYKSHLYNI